MNPSNRVRQTFVMCDTLPEGKVSWATVTDGRLRKSPNPPSLRERKTLVVADDLCALSNMAPCRSQMTAALSLLFRRGLGSIELTDPIPFGEPPV